MPRKRLSKKATVLYLLVGFFAAYLLICYRMAAKLLHPLRDVPITPKWVRDVKIPTAAGPDPAWMTPNLSNASTIVVMAHGLGGTREGWAELMKSLPPNGIAAVAPSMPGQDGSPDSSVGFGPKEAQVVVDTVNWIRSQRTDRPKIVLLGVSMGGAGVWLASQLDPSVDGVISDCAYAEFPKAMHDWFEASMRGGSIVFAPTAWMAQWMSGIDPKSIMPVKAAEAWKGRPALVIQAGNDRLIARSQADELVKASGAEFWLVPGAGHAQCVSVDPSGYEARVVAFVKKLQAGP